MLSSPLLEILWDRHAVRGHAAVSARLGSMPDGGLWIKDETVNVSGSHNHFAFATLLRRAADRNDLDEI